ncbi:anhydro-N-acetylmuramic acid kinase [Polaromonas aquatica]|uniref:anhydro-N-acetylmuramic acid kinase n=1 Tax=Polaromonas aquatica TaxID=332657 RepID=UPI003D646A7B
MTDLYVGLMSGTSLDGADGVLVDFADGKLRVLAAATEAFDGVFRAELLALNSPTHNELHRAAIAANHIAAAYAKVVHSLLDQVAARGISASQVRAIGAHGQTVRHQPQRTSPDPAGAGYTLQLNNPALLAELTGIDVAADFRSRDVAAGGQGAPLAPAFHQGVFGRTDTTVCVLNLGGISNLSVLPPGGPEPVLGFDCGPGNALMDAWCLQHTGRPYDAGGAWAATGKLLPGLLASLLGEPYFAQPIPKSTGRDLFSMQWLSARLQPFSAERPEDIQNTLAEFTARACIEGVNRYGKGSKSLIVCGGGAFNTYLLERLQAGLPQLQVSTSDAHGLPPLQVEAAAFAWLAQQVILRKPGNLPSVTGASGLRVLGAIYPANAQ